MVTRNRLLEYVNRVRRQSGQAPILLDDAHYTVRDLIAALKKLPKDLPVYFLDEEYGEIPVETVRVMDASTSVERYHESMPRRVVIGDMPGDGQ